MPSKRLAMSWSWSSGMVPFAGWFSFPRSDPTTSRRVTDSLPAPGVHFPVWIGAQSADLIERLPLTECEAGLGAPVAAPVPPGPDQGRQFLVRGSSAQRLAQVHPAGGVETQQ